MLLNEDLKKLFWKELDNVDSFMERRNRLITDLRTDLRKIGANLSVTLVNGGYQLHFSLENSKKSVKNQVRNQSFSLAVGEISHTFTIKT